LTTAFAVVLVTEGAADFADEPQPASASPARSSAVERARSTYGRT